MGYTSKANFRRWGNEPFLKLLGHNPVKQVQKWSSLKPWSISLFQFIKYSPSQTKNMMTSRNFLLYVRILWNSKVSESITHFQVCVSLLLVAVFFPPGPNAIPRAFLLSHIIIFQLRCSKLELQFKWNVHGCTDLDSICFNGISQLLWEIKHLLKASLQRASILGSVAQYLGYQLLHAVQRFRKAYAMQLEANLHNS